ncbi:MAG: alkaline shock response membrane anchor protein AmaP [Clostridia bacterium]|nr:alkaline shock response membrane anchor protein AmaP [Clostridia bacterium]
MKLRIADRILVACAGLLLLAACAGLVAQLFFGADLVSLAVRAFSSESASVRWILIGIAVILLLLGLYCLLVLFRHRKKKDRFVLQKNESGELAISLKALQNMIQKCVDQHEEIQVQHMDLEVKKDGLLIQIRGAIAGGISIPLTVENMQKQIHQYVTACSGVDIKSIRVQIDESGKDAADAPFAIAAPTAKPLLKDTEENTAHKEPVEAYVSAPPYEAQEEQKQTEESTPTMEEHAPTTPVPPASYETEIEEEDERPLHQRIFSPTVEPCVYPEPPTEEEIMQPQEDAESWKTDESQEPEEAPDYNTEWQWQTEEETPDGTTDETVETQQPLEQADNGYEPETEDEGETESVVSDKLSENADPGMPAMAEPEQTIEISGTEDEEVILNPEEKE